MLGHFTQEDKEQDYNNHHKLATAQARDPADTTDDKDFSVEETRNAVARMDLKKAPGEYGIIGEEYKSDFEIFPRYITAMYKCCLRTGVFPRRRKTAYPSLNQEKRTATRFPNSAP
jgi:hypothetical protein